MQWISIREINYYTYVLKLERERDLCGGLRVIYPSNNWSLGEERNKVEQS